MWPLLLVATAGAAEIEPKLSVSGATDDKASLEAALSWRWGAPDKSDAGITEHAVTVSAGVATAKGKASIVPDELPNGGLFGVSVGWLWKEMPSREELEAEFAPTPKLIADQLSACTELCKPDGGAQGEDVKWCADNKNALASGLLNNLDLCSAGKKLAKVAESATATKATLPNYSAFQFGGKVTTTAYDWVVADDAGLVTEDDAVLVGYGAWLAGSHAFVEDGPAPNANTLEGHVKFASGHEASDTTAEWCESKGTFETADGAAVEACEDATYGEPAPSMSVNAQLLVGVVPKSLGRWRAAIGPTYDITFDADGVSHVLGAAMPFYADLSRPDHQGKFKGILKITPTLAYDLTEGQFTPGVQIALLTQKYLLDPTLAP